MNKIVELMVNLLDIQKEIFDKVIVKFPKVDSRGGFASIISSTNVKTTGSKVLYVPKNITFEKAIENLLFNLKKLDIRVVFHEYTSLVERVENIRDEIITLNAMNMLIEDSDEYNEFIDKNSFEYRLIDFKFFYDSIMDLDIKKRHSKFNDYYKKFDVKKS